MMSGLFSRVLEGPPCPVCRRTDGSHNGYCEVPDYLASWRRIRRNEAERIVNEIWPDTVKECHA